MIRSLAVSLLLYFRRGGFTPEEDLTNANTPGTAVREGLSC